MTGLLALVLHAALMAGMALLLAGLMPWVRARLDGRVGARLWQPWHDWRRLMRKRPVLPEGTSPLLAWAPATSLAATSSWLLLVPSFTLDMATAPMADLLVIAGLLALARVVMLLGAIDVGTGPAGLAAVRTVRLGSLAEPVLLLVIFTVALLTGTTNLNAAIASLHEAGAPGVALLLALCALGCVMIAVEASVDPLLCELSGWHVAAVEATVALRRVVWLSLVAALLLPGGLASSEGWPADWLEGLGAWMVKLVVLGAICAMAGPALRRAGQTAVGPVMGAAVLLGLLAALFLFSGQSPT